MATFVELATIIAEQLGRALDDPFTEMMKERIKYWRSRHIRNSLEKDPRSRKFFTQTVTLEMEEVEATECGINLNCKLMRSKSALPFPVRANGVLFDSVASIDGSNPFKFVKRHELPYLIGDRYSPLVSDFYLYENGYILTQMAPYVFVEGIFDDPLQIAEISCNNSSTSGCNIDDVDLAISGDIAQLIVQSILEVDFGQKKKEDTSTEEVEVTNNPKP